MQGRVWLGIALTAALTSQSAVARPWSIGASYETDDASAHIEAADLWWGPSEQLSVLVDAGLLFVGESLNSASKAELVVGRRRVQLNFNGAGYGLNGTLAGDRFTLYATYMGYHYADNVDRLIAFLTNRALARRPRLQGLVNSGLTSAGALLHRSATIGTDVFVGEQRFGITMSQFHEIVADTRTNVLQTELEWPVSHSWTGQCTLGASDTQGFGTTYFFGTRFTFYGR